jgi:hypothetical protein
MLVNPVCAYDLVYGQFCVRITKYQLIVDTLRLYKVDPAYYRPAQRGACAQVRARGRGQEPAQ